MNKSVLNQARGPAIIMYFGLPNPNLTSEFPYYVIISP